MSSYGNSSYTPPASVSSGGSANFRPSDYTGRGSGGGSQLQSFQANPSAARAASANYGSQVGAATGAALSTYGANLSKTLGGGAASLPTYTPTVKPLGTATVSNNYGLNAKTMPAPVVKKDTSAALAKLLAEARGTQPMHGGGSDKRGSWNRGKWGWNTNINPAIPAGPAAHDLAKKRGSPNERAIASTAAARAAQQLKKVQLAQALVNARKDPGALGRSILSAGGKKPNPALSIQMSGASAAGTNTYSAALGAKKVPFTSSNAGKIIRAGQTIAPYTGAAGILEKGNEGRSALSGIAGAFNKKAGQKIEGYTEKAVSAVVPEKARSVIGNYLDQVRQVDKGVTPLGEQGRTFSPELKFSTPPGLDPSKGGVYGPSSKTTYTQGVPPGTEAYIDKFGNRSIRNKFTPEGKEEAPEGKMWKRVQIRNIGITSGILEPSYFQWRLIDNPLYQKPITTDSYIDPKTVSRGGQLGDQTRHQQALKGASQTQRDILDSQQGNSDSLAQLYNDHRDSFNSDLSDHHDAHMALAQSGLPKGSAAYANRKAQLDAKGEALLARRNEGMELKGKVDSARSMMQGISDRTSSAGSASSAADKAYDSLASKGRRDIGMTTLGDGSQGGKIGKALKDAATFAQMFPGGRPYAAGAYTAAQILSARNQVKDRRAAGLNISQSLLDVASSNAFAAASGLLGGISGGIQTAGNFIHPTVGKALSSGPRLLTNAAQLALNAAEGGVQTAIGTANVPPGYAKTGGFDAYGKRIIPGGGTGYSKTPEQAAADALAGLSGEDRDVIQLMDGGYTYQQALEMKKSGSLVPTSEEARITLNAPGYAKETLNGVSMWVPPGYYLRADMNAPANAKRIEAVPNGTSSVDWSVQGLKPYDTQQMAWDAAREKEATDFHDPTGNDYAGSRTMAESGLHKPETYGLGKFGGAINPTTFQPVTASQEELKQARPKTQGITTGTLFSSPGGFTTEGGMTDEDFLPKPTVGRYQRPNGQRWRGAGRGIAPTREPWQGR